MGRRTKEAAQQTREQILDAAVEVFYARGVARPSLTDIATLAGVTRGAVYGHFKNKGDVFAALCDRIRLPLEELSARDACAGPGNPLESLKRVWVTFLEETAADQQRQRILGIIFHRCELMEENGRLLQRLQEGREHGMSHMAALLHQAVACGQLPADLDTERALRLFHAGVAGLLSDWLFEPEAFDLKTEAAPAVEALIEMLRIATALRRQQSPADVG